MFEGQPVGLGRRFFTDRQDGEPLACDFARGEIDPPVASLLQGEDMGMHQKMRSDEEILGSYQGNVPCSMQVPLENFEVFLAWG